MPPFRWRMKPFDEREINGVIEIALYEKEMELKLKKANEQLNHANRSNETSSAPHGAAREASPEHGLEQSSINDQRSTIQKVLVMDEATSALDEATEKEVVSEIRRLKGDITMIVIAHRYNTLKYCDRIYRLDNGRIVEKTTYVKLMENQEYSK